MVRHSRVKLSTNNTFKAHDEVVHSEPLGSLLLLKVLMMLCSIVED